MYEFFYLNLAFTAATEINSDDLPNRKLSTDFMNAIIQALIN